MTTTTLLLRQDHRILLSGARVERGAFAVLRAADEVLKEARREMEDIRQQAREDASRIVESARSQGFDEGRREGIERLFGTLEIEARLRLMLTERIADLVEQAVRNILGDIPAPEQLRRRILRLLDVNGAAHDSINLHVCPAQAPQAQVVVAGWMREHGAHGRWLTIVADERCEADALVLETPTGFFDGRIELTLGMMRAVLRNALAQADLYWGPLNRTDRETSGD